MAHNNYNATAFISYIRSGTFAHLFLKNAFITNNISSLDTVYQIIMWPAYRHINQQSLD